MVLRIGSFVLALQAALFGADPPISGYEGEVKKVIDRALSQYGAASSYQDKLVIEVEIDTEGDRAMPTSKEQVGELTFTWAGGNRVALDGPTYAVFADGKKLWQHIKPLEQYIESPVPKQIDWARLELSEFDFYTGMRHPIASVVGREAGSPHDLFGKVARFTGIEAEPLAGKPGKRISGMVTYGPSGAASTAVPFDAWFSDQAGLLEEVRYDHTAWVRKTMALAGPSGRRSRINKYLQRFRFEKIRLNEKVPKASFEFKPGPYDEKVTRFRLLASEEEWQRRLIGRPAPDFKGRDLAGQAIRLSDFKGQVVLLDFWASWCGPCLMVMPIMQKLADRFAEKRVSFIGINSDEPALKGRVREILRKQKIRYRQYMDSGGKVFADYRVQPIPCFVLIGRKGVIQAIHRGFAPGEDQRLAEDIEKLLKGEDLFVTTKAVGER